MDYQSLTAPCGLPCFVCYLYLARELGLPLEQTACPGCRALQGQPAHLPMRCRVYPCARERGVQLCRDCADFPGDLLHPYADNAKVWHNIKVFQLGLIKKLGWATWASGKAPQVLEVYSHGKWAVVTSRSKRRA